MDAYDGPLEAAMALVDQFGERNDVAAAQAREALASAAEAADKTAASYEALQEILGEYVRKTAEASAVLEANARYQEAVAEATEKTAFALEAAGRAADALENDYAQLAAVEQMLASRSADLEHGQAMVAAALGMTAGQVDELTRADLELAAAEGIAGDAALGMAAKVTAAGTAADAAGGRAFRFWGLTGTALHWIIALSAEIIAVVGPAMVALGAWAAVVMQGAQNAATHMTSLWQATEATSNMFHESMGQALGLAGALQQAQNAANPMVYQNLGSALIIVKEHFQNLAGTGLQVESIFTTFMAKLAYEFSPGGSLGNAVDGLLRAMVPDLVKLAQVLGNTAHALAGFANSMPGLAEVLLTVLRNITGLASVLFNNPIGHYLLLIGIGMEEAWRWGGLLGRGLAFLVGWVGKAADALALLSVRLGATGLADALAGAGGMLEKTAAFLSGPWGWAAIAASVAVGFLIDKILTAKDATQQWIDSQNRVIANASNFSVLTRVTEDMASVQERLTANQRAATEATLAEATMNGRATGAMEGAINASRELSAQQRQLQQDMINYGHGVTFLATTYHTSYVGALALAQEAGVNLTQQITGQSEAASILRFKIASLVAGYTAMGQPVGVIGKDMDALSIASMEQQSKVQQLNQAWDSFIQTLVGGTQNMAQFEQSITSLTKGSNNITTILGKSGSVTLSVNDFARSLQSMTGKGAQAWQNFDQVVGSTAPQLIDWLRTAGSEGELSGAKFTQAIRDVVAQMLPFAKDSQTATSELSGLAQMANGPATSSFSTLKNWTDQSHTSISNLQSIIGTTTTKMSNMAQVAQNLGAVMQSDIISTMDQAKLSVDNVGKATIAYTQTLQNNNSTSQQVHGSYDQMVRVLTQVTGNNKLANTIAQTYARSMGDDTEKAYKYTAQTHQLAGALNSLHNRYFTITGKGTGVYSISTNAGTEALLHHATVGAGGTTSKEAHVAAGGIMRGGVPGQDSIHALLMPGEGVLTTRAVRMVGEHTVHALNRMAESGSMHQLHRMASGGIAGDGIPQLAKMPGQFQNQMTADMIMSMERSMTAAERAAAAAAAAAGGRGMLHPTGSGGSVEALMRSMAASIGWTGQLWTDLYNVEMREAGFNLGARNPSSGAYGLAQFINGPSEYAQYGGSAGSAAGQITAMLNYIRQRYGNPAGAWAHELQYGWYDKGGYLPPGLSLAANGTGRPEPVGDAGEIVVPVTVMLDSKVLFKSVQRSGRQYARRQGGRGGGDRVFNAGA